MATSANAQIGSGVTLTFYDTALSPAVYTTLGKVRNIGGYGQELPEVDSTTLDSQAVERIAGLRDGREVSIVLTFTAATQAKIESLCGSETPKDFKLVFPSPGALTRYFTLTPRGYEIPTIVASGLLETTFTGRISGAISATDPHA